MPTAPKPQRRRTRFSKALRKKIAIVDLFAGIRTAHLAAALAGADVVLAVAAENCPFANSVAQRNHITETLVEDIKLLTQEWAEKFAAEAEEKGAHLILIVAGFPCKGLSACRGRDRPNLHDPHSKLFWCVPKVRAWLKRFANVPVLIIIENVVMQVPPMLTISQTLGCRPTRVAASRVCAAARNRLFWTDFEIIPDSCETLERD